MRMPYVSYQPAEPAAIQDRQNAELAAAFRELAATLNMSPSDPKRLIYVVSDLLSQHTTPVLKDARHRENEAVILLRCAQTLKKAGIGEEIAREWNTRALRLQSDAVRLRAAIYDQPEPGDSTEDARAAYEDGGLGVTSPERDRERAA